jgi:hypothetical protein
MIQEQRPLASLPSPPAREQAVRGPPPWQAPSLAYCRVPVVQEPSLKTPQQTSRYKAYKASYHLASK